MQIDTTTFRLATFLTGLLLLLTAETIRPARPWKTLRSKRIIFHASLSAFNTVLLRFPAYIPLIALLNYTNTHRIGLTHTLKLSPAANIIATVILFDMFDYWWHRFNHRIPILWRFHKVHHVDTHVDTTTSLRFHPGELAISFLFKAVWIVLWSPTLWAYTIFEASVTFSAQFHHTNIDFPDPIENTLRKVFVTPCYHTAHHTVNQRTGNNNFATIFILWDRLFSTYRLPDFEEMKYLGLPKGRNVYLKITQTLTAPFRNIY